MLGRVKASFIDVQFTGAIFRILVPPGVCTDASLAHAFTVSSRKVAAAVTHDKRTLSKWSKLYMEHGLSQRTIKRRRSANQALFNRKIDVVIARLSAC